MKKNSKNQGQIMLISLMVLGGVLAIGLGVAVTLLNEVRLARQSLDSAKAIYAADAGVECELYKYFRDQAFICDPSEVIFLNNASFTSVINPGTATSAQAIGISRGIRRALEVLIPI